MPLFHHKHAKKAAAAVVPPEQERSLVAPLARNMLREQMRSKEGDAKPGADGDANGDEGGDDVEESNYTEGGHDDGADDDDPYTEGGDVDDAGGSSYEPATDAAADGEDPYTEGGDVDGDDDEDPYTEGGDDNEDPYTEGGDDDEDPYTEGTGEEEVGESDYTEAGVEEDEEDEDDKVGEMMEKRPWAMVPRARRFTLEYQSDYLDEHGHNFEQATERIVHALAIAPIITAASVELAMRLADEGGYTEGVVHDSQRNSMHEDDIEIGDHVVAKWRAEAREKKELDQMEELEVLVESTDGPMLHKFEREMDKLDRKVHTGENLLDNLDALFDEAVEEFATE